MQANGKDSQARVKKPELALWLALFALSGAAGLIYQNIWVRIASLILGGTAAAISLVLAAFFIGLALGALLISRPRFRDWSPLKNYAFLELGIGVCAILATEILFYIGSRSFSLLGKSFLLDYFLILLLVALPASLMGATFPLMVAILRERLPALKAPASQAYAANAMGAVVGALATGFLLIPFLGVSGAAYCGFSFNAVIAVLAFFMLAPKSAKITTASTSIIISTRGWWRSDRGLGLSLVAFLAGALAMGLEVQWARWLGLLVGANLYGLSVILAVAISGVALGGLISARLGRLPGAPATQLQVIFLVASVVLALHSWLLSFVPELALLATRLLPTVSVALWKYLFAAILLLPVSALIGTILPFLIDFADADAESQAAIVDRSGSLYAANTVGGIIGSLVVGLWAIPVLGASLTLKCLLLLTAFMALALRASRRGEAPFKRQALQALVVLLPLGMALIHPGIDYRSALLTAYAQRPQSSESLAYLDPEQEKLWRVFEGKNSVVSLSHRFRDDAGKNIWLKQNGLNESYFNTQMQTAIPKYEGLLPTLALAGSANPQDGFVIGYGGGHSAGFLAQYGLKRLLVAEIEPKVVEAAKFATGRTTLDGVPGAELRFDDARRVLLEEPLGAFDFAISQPSHSWISGVANLFTREFFELVSSRLRNDGVFVQWLNLYNSDPEALSSIFSAFFSVFPEGAVFSDDGDQEVILLGWKRPQAQITNRAFTRIISVPQLKAQLASVPIHDLWGVASMYLADRENFLPVLRNVPVNSDRNAYAESRQSRFVYSKEFIAPLQKLYPHAHFAGFTRLFPDARSATAEQVGISRDSQFLLFEALANSGKNLSRFRWLAEQLELNASPLSAQELLRMGKAALALELSVTANRWLGLALAFGPEPETMQNFLANLTHAGEYDAALAVIAAHPKIKSEAIRCYELDLRSRILTLSKSTARELQKWSVDLRRCGPFGARALAEIAAHELRFPEALQAYQDFLKEYPQDPLAAERLAKFAKIAKNPEAEIFAEAAKRAKQNEYFRLTALADAYREAGWPEDAEALARRARLLAPDKDLAKQH